LTWSPTKSILNVAYVFFHNSEKHPKALDLVRAEHALPRLYKTPIAIDPENNHAIVH